jgi:3-oxoacyl-[acyl-carrier protein] reductase
MNHEGRVAVVTGGASGIGLAIAMQLVQEQAAVAIVGRDSDKLARALDEIERVHPQAQVRAYPADVANDVQLQAAIERARRDLGRIGILVNNAGVSPKKDGKKVPAAQLATDEWRRTLDVNLSAAFFAARACIADFEAARWGRVISISSVAGRTRSDVVGAHYAAAKAGLIGLSRVLAVELAPFGVTVNCIAPGQIDTGMTDAPANAAYLPRIPVGRIGVPQDIAAAVSYLASDAASFVTGATLDVTGGSFMP